MDYWVDTDRFFEPSERESFPLIHMTQNWEILELILTEGLKPSYCKENLTNDKENKEACREEGRLNNEIKEYLDTLQSCTKQHVSQKKNLGEDLSLDQKKSLTEDVNIKKQGLWADNVMAKPETDTVKRER